MHCDQPCLRKSSPKICRRHTLPAFALGLAARTGARSADALAGGRRTRSRAAVSQLDQLSLRCDGCGDFHDKL